MVVILADLRSHPADEGGPLPGTAVLVGAVVIVATATIVLSGLGGNRRRTSERTLADPDR